MRGVDVGSSDITKDELNELRELREIERKLVAQKGLDDLWYFITEILWPDVADKHYQEDLHKPLADWVTKDAKPGCRKLILMPRRSRKSYVCNVAKCTQLVLKDPNIRILVVCSNFSLAQEFLGVIKRIFQYNPGIKKYYPNFHVSSSTQFGTKLEFTHPLRTMHQLVDPTIRAAYLGAALAGKRCDVLICDDPVEKSHVTTPEQADKALHNFNDLIPLVDDNPDYNQVFVIGTRWSYMDVYGALLGESRGDDTKVELGDKRRYEAIVRHCLENEKGEPDVVEGTPIFHKVFTKAKLLDILEEYKSDVKQGEEDWWKQFMNVCTSPKGRKFLPEWFDSWVDRLPGDIVWSGIVLDSATKDEQVIMRGDHTAAHVGHFTSSGHLYLTNALHSDELRSPDLMRRLLTLSQYMAPGQGEPVSNVVKEKVGEEMFFGMVREWYNRNNMPISVYPCTIRGMGKKVLRMTEALQGPLQARRVHFVKGYPREIWRRLVDELVHIGQWAHDDLGDALSLFFHKDIRIISPSTISKGWERPRNMRIPQIFGSKGVPRGLRSGDTGEDGSFRDDPFVSDMCGKSWDVAGDGSLVGFRPKKGKLR